MKDRMITEGKSDVVLRKPAINFINALILREANMEVIYFDIGDTLARAEFAADGKLVLHPLPGAIAALDALGKRRKGIISNPGDGPAAQAQAQAALQAVFGKYFGEPALLHWGRKDSSAIFERAVKASGVQAAACLFVGEHAGERQFAQAAGMRTAATPQQAVQALASKPGPATGH